MENLARKAVFVLTMSLCCGCSLMPHSLHPSQLWKMNRQDAWDEGTLSVPDPVDARLTQAPVTGVADAPAGDSTAP
jgi:hypothetical protein